MPVVLGVDVGTTTITALALDTASGSVFARATVPNQAACTSPTDKARGFSEWDSAEIVGAAIACMRQVAGQLRTSRKLAGIGLTGQQHGVVIVDSAGAPLSPLINWQDRRGEEIFPGAGHTFVQEAARRLGPDAPQRAGCKLASGFMATTLFWLKEHNSLPESGVACFITDHFASSLTGVRACTDPTNAAGSGVFDVRINDWSADLIAALGLPRNMFPEVRRSGDLLGTLLPEMAAPTGLPAGIPVFVGIGDHQASFVGSVGKRDESVLINVGTGAQVAAFTEEFIFDPALETRPFPRGGYLLVCPGLCGGRCYAILESFFRQVGTQVIAISNTEAVYGRMDELAATVPPGANGLRCEPFFAGTRADPLLRASWSGMSAENFTPAHLTRALLEGMARAFRSGYETIRRHLPSAPRNLVGAGNGLRENPLLVRIVSEEFGLPVRLPVHREEAAYGAALLASVGLQTFPDCSAAGAVIRYE